VHGSPYNPGLLETRLEKFTKPDFSPGTSHAKQIGKAMISLVEYLGLIEVESRENLGKPKPLSVSPCICTSHRHNKFM
jgi:hypothetical protein